jgi:hypothetical protein
MVARGETPTEVSKIRIKPEYLVDPLGVGFLIYKGKVRAPAYDAAALTRRLADPFASWKAVHPGELAKAADFPHFRSTLAPYLRLEITLERLVIKGLLPPR